MQYARKNLSLAANSDNLIVSGAAIFADHLYGEQNNSLVNLEIIELTNPTIGVKTFREKMIKLIPSNS